MAHLEGYRW